MIIDQAEELKKAVLGPIRDPGFDKILDILIQAGIIELKPLESGGKFVCVNSMHNHNNAYEDVGENFLGSEIKG